MVEPATAARAATAYRKDALASQRRHRRVHVAQVQSPLQRLQALADASPQVAQLMRLQTLADSAGAGVLQRKSPEEEELLQGKFATRPVASALNRTGMPDGLKSGIEALSGMAMDHVRVHYNSKKPAQLNGGVFVNDDPSLEREADQMGERALAAGG